MRMRVCTVFFLLILCPSAFAQMPGTCERGVAQGDLNADGSEVFARVFNTGALFFGNETTSGNGYLVPRLAPGGGEGPSPLFATTLWIGGQVDNELRVAAARYTRYEMWPGPLNAGATLPNPADCSAYDRIFVVSREDVARYLRTGVASDDLLDWPVSWGGPVLDVDGVDGNYNLEGGDQPAIHGEHMAWWVMNDVGNAHEETGSNPLGIEVQVSAFTVGTGLQALRQASYYRYVIVNRNSFAIDSAYVSLFMDADLGDGGDDQLGSDTTLSMGYVYNYDNSDAVYGIPPAQGYQIVQGPAGLPNLIDDDGDGMIDEADEEIRLTRMTTWCGGCTQPATNDPRTAHEYYNHMRGRWKDGTPFTEAGFGYETDGPETLFVFAGDPITEQCWSHPNDCQGGTVPPARANIIVHTGPFHLASGESTEVVFAMPFAQGTDYLDSVTQLRNAAYATRGAWETGLLNP